MSGAFVVGNGMDRENGSAVRIVVRGLPISQGSKRYVGNGIMIDSIPALKPWRIAVTHEAVAEKIRTGIGTFTGAVSMRVVFSFPDPRAARSPGCGRTVSRTSIRICAPSAIH